MKLAFLYTFEILFVRDEGFVSSQEMHILVEFYVHRCNQSQGSQNQN